MRISICNENAKSTVLHPWDDAFSEFAQLFSNPPVADKDGSYFIRGEASVRNNESLKTAELVIIDCDTSIDPNTGATFKKTDSNYSGCPNPKLIADVLKDAGLEFFIYTTHSHTATVNKCRVILPFVCNTPEELKNAVDYVMDLIRSAGILLADAYENYVWSQPWYAARIAMLGALYYHYYNAGKLLDKADIDASVAARTASLTKLAVKTIVKTKAKNLSSKPQAPSELDRLNASVTLDDYATLLTTHGYTYSHESEFNNAPSHLYVRPGSISGGKGVHVYEHETTESLCYKTFHGEDDKLHLTEGGFGFYADAVNCLEHDGTLTHAEKVELMRNLFSIPISSVIEQGIKNVSLDVGAVFEDDFIDALNLQKEESVADYMRTLQKIQVANKNVTKTDLEKACKKRAVKEETSQAADIIKLLEENMEVFHDSERTGYAEVKVGNHTEIIPIKSSDFSFFVRSVCNEETGIILKESVINDVIDTLNGKAIIQYEERPVFRRCAKLNDEYIIDIGNDMWQAIAVSSSGYKILDKSPVALIRSDTTLPLPIPDRDNADLSLLLDNINISPKDIPLVLAFLIDTFRGDTAFVLLLLCGFQGTCKSAAAKLIKLLTDASTANLRVAPKKIEEFINACANSHVIAYDNVSKISDELHDLFCVACSIDGTYTCRELYTNKKESVIHLKSPIIITGITDLITRPDLAERTVKLRLQKIPASKRKDDQEVAEQFKKDAPKIMAGLLDLFAETLAELPTTSISSKLRMASYTKLGVAMVNTPTFKKLGIPCDFLSLFKDNQQSSIDDAIESSAVADLLRQLMPKLKDNHYSGTFKGLFDNLSLIKGSTTGFPKSYKGLSDELRRLEPALSTVGITVERDEKPKKDGKHVHITYTPTENENVISENDVNHHQQKNDGDELHIMKLVPAEIKNAGNSHDIFDVGTEPNSWVNGPTISGDSLGGASTDSSADTSSFDPFAPRPNPKPFG